MTFLNGQRMKRVERTSAFDKDLKKIGLSAPLIDVLHHLINDKKLPIKYRDHSLKGKFSIFRECHIQPDLLLIYYIENDVVKLVRLGSHSQLFG